MIFVEVGQEIAPQSRPSDSSMKRIFSRSVASPKVARRNSRVGPMSSSNHSPSSTGMMPSSLGAEVSLSWDEPHLLKVKFGDRFAGVGEDKAGAVERIAARYATDSIGEQCGHVSAGIRASESDLPSGTAGDNSSCRPSP